MSALLASTLAAAALASAPPSFGSEPYVIGFESAPVHGVAQPRAASAEVPRLVASLGSEPFLPGLERVESSPAAVTRDAPGEAMSLLAASLGSEPFLPGVTESGSPRAPEAQRTQQETLARNCHCG